MPPLQDHRTAGTLWPYGVAERVTGQERRRTRLRAAPQFGERRDQKCCGHWLQQEAGFVCELSWEILVHHEIQVPLQTPVVAMVWNVRSIISSPACPAHSHWVLQSLDDAGEWV